jgi:N-acetylneuraminate synthase/N,N'-diacetyllegionaminate synthase
MTKTIIIAEAGVNHNGDINIARKLIDKAVEAGADYVKFQTFKAEKLVSKSAKKAEYQFENDIGQKDTQFEMLKNLELSEQAHFDLKKYATSKKIKFLSAGFDEESIDFLDKLNVDFFKIPSGEITNKPYLQHIARKGKPVIVSTGMATLKEIEDALNVLYKEGLSEKQITVLHCNTEYPTPMQDVNLKAMITIQKAFNVNIGYSDHTLGIEVPIAAVALGARVIEKHFTLDRSLPGPDHRASLEPGDFKRMVQAIRNIEDAIEGDGMKRPSNSEQKNIDIARKSIFVRNSLDLGHIIQIEDLIMLRPGNGISPMDIEKVLGKKIVKKISHGSKFDWIHFR